MIARTRPRPFQPFTALAMLALLARALALPADAAGPSDLRDGGRAHVVAVVDGDTVALDDGREVRFVGIQAPKLPLGRPNFRKWPFADEARDAIVELAQGHDLTLYYGGRDTDRHRRALAHLVTDDGVWLQCEMLRRGLARVYSFADNRALVREMLAIEAEARAARRGIWRLDWYAVTAADEAQRRIGEFALIEGRVVATDVVRGRGFVNFGPDHKTDFTASIAPRNLKTFLREGIDIARYEGRLVRIWGWVKSYNGPMVDVTHPEQIEVLDDETG
ncbi:MAG: thermonuclease family protein [Alphaproteobacteria bacterium]|jgi:micrococcal nuclease